MTAKPKSKTVAKRRAKLGANQAWFVDPNDVDWIAPRKDLTLDTLLPILAKLKAVRERSRFTHYTEKRPTKKHFTWINSIDDLKPIIIAPKSPSVTLSPLETAILVAALRERAYRFRTMVVEIKDVKSKKNLRMFALRCENRAVALEALSIGRVKPA
jgi:hypothetical protein